jgi:hypothetical protein
MNTNLEIAESKNKNAILPLYKDVICYPVKSDQEAGLNYL